MVRGGLTSIYDKAGMLVGNDKNGPNYKMKVPEHCLRDSVIQYFLPLKGTIYFLFGLS